MSPPTALDVTNRDQVHKTVMGMFPDHQTDNARAAASILFRVETGRTPSVLVSSTVQPTRLVDGAVTREMNPLNGVAEGEDVSFRLALNPVKRNTVDVNGKRKIVTRALTVDEVGDYLAERLGDALDDVLITNINRVTAGCDRKDGRHGIVIDTIDGIGTVTDLVALKRHLTNGVGRAKSFGAGMLTVRPE